MTARPRYSCFFFFNDTATTEIYTLSLHDALPISTVLFPRDQVEGEGAEGHRDDGVERVGVARAHEVAEPLIHDVDAAAVVVFGRRFLERRPHLVPDPAQLLVPEHVGLFALEAHALVRREAGGPPHPPHPIPARGFVSVLGEPLRQLLDVDRM